MHASISIDKQSSVHSICKIDKQNFNMPNVVIGKQIRIVLHYLNSKSSPQSQTLLPLDSRVIKLASAFRHSSKVCVRCGGLEEAPDNIAEVAEKLLLVRLFCKRVNQ